VSDKKEFDWDAFRKEQKDREDAAKQERQRQTQQQAWKEEEVRNEPNNEDITDPSSSGG
jgi:hypothetical protein